MCLNLYSIKDKLILYISRIKTYLGLCVGLYCVLVVVVDSIINIMFLDRKLHCYTEYTIIL